MRIQGIAQDAADRNTWKRIADNALKGLHTHTLRGQVHERLDRERRSGSSATSKRIHATPTSVRTECMQPYVGRGLSSWCAELLTLDDAASKEDHSADERSLELLRQVGLLDDVAEPVDNALRLALATRADGRNTLHWVAINGHVKLCKCIILEVVSRCGRSGTLLRMTKDNDGWLPLLLAIMKGRLECTREKKHTRK